MRNIRYLLKDEYTADSIAEDLKVQLEVNRMNHIKITSVNTRNEVIVSLPEGNENLEEVVESFMSGYKTGEILE
ncbi:hypothetical protein SM124_07335 [Bacillus sp. 31A1R]|uniref:Uncharacterized protein n=1 Tax=Robertmurraya mangrovi TaxID=3098077 RepID=A0ABU5IWL4_9BACI|nr:hypothetical protein [Bacillus sp. 31A1R]MDZ5471558.1 hypothetical protein [Bacillus sp. 31A1R]